MQSTTYHSKGGRSIRQNQDIGNNLVVVEERQTDFVEKARCHGADSFTNDIWSSDMKDITKWAKQWAYYPKLLVFKLKKENNETIQLN